MSLHDLMAQDLAHVLGDTAHGFAVHATIAGWPVTGILDREYVEALGTESRRPVLRVQEAALPGQRASNARHGQAVVVEEPMPRGRQRYTVAGVQPDGVGEVVIVLQEAT